MFTQLPTLKMKELAVALYCAAQWTLCQSDTNGAGNEDREGKLRQKLPREVLKYDRTGQGHGFILFPDQEDRKKYTCKKRKGALRS